MHNITHCINMNETHAHKQVGPHHLQKHYAVGNKRQQKPRYNRFELVAQTGGDGLLACGP